jgi:hypothetical protein
MEGGREGKGFPVGTGGGLSGRPVKINDSGALSSFFLPPSLPLSLPPPLSRSLPPSTPFKPTWNLVISCPQVARRCDHRPEREGGRERGREDGNGWG